jgi:glycine/betaine/sarcosine/D-proline reductase family selenoprotein B
VAEEPIALSRLCVPFTPFRGRLEEAVVCLVTTAGVRPRGAEPFAEDDLTHRVIPADLPASALAVDHARYPREGVEADGNCVFPIDRLRALAAEGRVGGLAGRHFATSYTLALREFAAGTAVRVAREVAAERPQAAVVTAGCRVCHRAAAALQRSIEMLGIPTVAVTAEAEETEQARVPRALCPAGFAPGTPLGPPGDAALQRRVLLDALELLLAPPRPGEVVRREYR